MRDIIINSCNISNSFLLINAFMICILAVIVLLAFNSRDIKKLGGAILVTIIFISSLLAYIDVNINKVADTYKAEKTEEFFIDNEQYNNIKNCLFKGRNEITDIFKNKDNSNIEKIKINIPNEIKDYSKNSEKRVIKVEVYKENTNKKYYTIDYPKEIKILKEIR